MDYYKILGISRNSNIQQIKNAYKSLALKYHPDRNLNNKNSENIFKKISEAYYILSNPQIKKYYDTQNINKQNTFFKDNTNTIFQKTYFNNPFDTTFYTNIQKNNYSFSNNNHSFLNNNHSISNNNHSFSNNNINPEFKKNYDKTTHVFRNNDFFKSNLNMSQFKKFNTNKNTSESNSDKTRHENGNTIREIYSKKDDTENTTIYINNILRKQINKNIKNNHLHILHYNNKGQLIRREIQS